MIRGVGLDVEMLLSVTAGLMAACGPFALVPCVV